MDINPVKPISFSVIASFEGQLDRVCWSAALAEVQRKHPLLDASIGSDVFRKGEQSIGVIIFNGALRCTHASFTWAEGLLAAARQLIPDACKIASS